MKKSIKKQIRLMMSTLRCSWNSGKSTTRTAKFQSKAVWDLSNRWFKWLIWVSQYWELVIAKVFGDFSKNYERLAIGFKGQNNAVNLWYILWNRQMYSIKQGSLSNCHLSAYSTQNFPCEGSISSDQVTVLLRTRSLCKSDICLQT